MLLTSYHLTYWLRICCLGSMCIRHDLCMKWSSVNYELTWNPNRRQLYIKPIQALPLLRVSFTVPTLYHLNTAWLSYEIFYWLIDWGLTPQSNYNHQRRRRVGPGIILPTWRIFIVRRNSDTRRPWLNPPFPKGGTVKQCLPHCWRKIWEKQ